MSREIVNLPASTHARLRNEARARKIPFQVLILRHTYKPERWAFCRFIVDAERIAEIYWASGH